MEVLYERGRWPGHRQGVGDGVRAHPGCAAWAAQRDADVQGDDGVAGVMRDWLLESGVTIGGRSWKPFARSTQSPSYRDNG